MTAITKSELDRAYDELAIAADLVEVAIIERMPKHVVEKRAEDMHRASEHLDRLQEMQLEQYEMAVA